MRSERAITRWVTLAAGVLSTALAVGPPVAWFVLSYERTVGGLDAEAEISAHLITQIIGADPELWEYEYVRLKEYLGRRPRSGEPEIRQVINLEGHVVAESADPLPSPRLRRSLPLMDAGARVGTIEISRSLRPILLRAGLLALLLAVPALLAFQALRTLPLRALRRTEGELRRQRDAAEKYLDVAGVAFVILDDAGLVTLVNRRGTELLARSHLELVGRPFLEAFVDPQERTVLPAAAARAAPDEVFNAEFAVIRPSGDRRIVNWYATALINGGGGRSGLILSGVDITHQRELEEQLRHAQKLRAVAQLAGGVAHDFNNVLAAIRSRAAMLRADLAIGSPHRLDAEEILAAADRAAVLTRSLLTFSRRQVVAAEPIDLCELIGRAERRLRRLIPSEIVLVTELPPAPLRVLADPVQIEQVLSNLVSNARDAIEGRGRITIRAGETVLDAEGARRNGLPVPGTFAQVTVADDGSGLDPAERSRLFEPFYTTKELGKGTGLGLAIAFGILELHRGVIRVESEPGRGTTVTFLLPLGTERPREEASAVEDVPASP